MITILEKENAPSKKIMTAKELNSSVAYSTHVFTADRKGRFPTLGYDCKVPSLYESNAKKAHKNLVKGFMDEGYRILYAENIKAPILAKKKPAKKRSSTCTKACAECGKLFKSRSRRIKYCSDECREKHIKERLRMRYVKAKMQKEKAANENQEG